MMGSEDEFEGRKLAKVLEVEGAEDDIELGRAEDSFNRAKNLVWIKKNSLYNEAWADWESQKKSLGAQFAPQEKRSEELTNQIYNLVGFFSVFQGVILTAVTQLTQSAQATQAPPLCPPRPPLCRKVWFPVVLTGLAAFVAVVGIALKFRDLDIIDQLIQKEKHQLRETIRKEEKLIRKGDKFKFRTLSTREDEGFRPEAGQVANVPSKVIEGSDPRAHWYLKAAAVILTVVAFIVIFILSYFVILCNKFGW